MGKEEWAGRCVLESGEALEGCAIQFPHGVIAYSNSQGYFSIRGKKAVSLPISVLPAIFAAPGDWIVVSAPDSISPRDTTLLAKSSNMPVLIVVKRK
jgi:hypothetical protein